MIIVDVNVIAYAFIEGEFTKQARQFFETTKDWIVPPIFEHEITNVLASYGRFKGLPVKSCVATLRDILRFTADRVAAADHEAVLTFAIRNGITAYDAEFLWLAETQGTVCVTEDAELLKRFPKLARSLRKWA